MSTIINATTTNGVVIQPDNSGSLVLQTNSGTTALTIDTSQNVGIGTTSPLSRLQVKAEGQNFGDGYILEKSSGTIMYNQVVGSDNALYLGYSSNGSSFATRMVMDSSGNLQFNSGYGSVATAYGCRAWVNFNGTGTPAIRASGNVTSITDNGTGNYTINFTTAMPDANYTVNVSAPMYSTTNNTVSPFIYGSGSIGSPGTQTTTQINVCWATTANPTTFFDPANYYVVIFR